MKIPYQLIKDESQFLPSEVSAVSSLSLAECLERRLLIGPDTKKELVASKEGDFLEGGFNSEDKTVSYAIKHGCPVL